MVFHDKDAVPFRSSSRRATCWIAAGAALICTAALLCDFSERGRHSVAALQGEVRPVTAGAQLPTPMELAHPLMKHLVVDKVYFPKNREDTGVAAVHGWVNGNYVEGNLNLQVLDYLYVCVFMCLCVCALMCIQYYSQRTAKYDAEDGSWSGVQNPPPRIAAYKSAVEGVVAQSIRAAMKSLLSPKKPALKLTTMGADPETALTNEIAKATHQAVEEELTVGSAGKAVAKLKARRAKSILKSVRSKLGQQLHSAPVKTIKGCMCRQTYVFRGKVHSGCIRLGGERGWCYTVANCGDNFEVKGKASLSWDHCEPELIRTVKG